jgi:hypothetical protein
LLFVLSLVLALGAGAGVRWLRGGAVRSLPPTPLTPAADAVRLGGDGREGTLLAATRKEVSLTNSDDFRKHLEATVQLGLLYLDQRRLSDAEKFFKDLRDKPPADLKIYSVYGKIGQAATLAFQDRPEESLKLFKELESAKLPPDRVGRPGNDWLRQMQSKGFRDLSAEIYLLNFSPQVRHLVAEALDHNLANLGGNPLPPEVERLRKLPQPGRGPGGPGPGPGGPR